MLHAERTAIRSKTKRHYTETQSHYTPMALSAAIMMLLAILPVAELLYVPRPTSRTANPGRYRRRKHNITQSFEKHWWQAQKFFGD